MNTYRFNINGFKVTASYVRGHEQGAWQAIVSALRPDRHVRKQCGPLTMSPGGVGMQFGILW